MKNFIRYTSLLIFIVLALFLVSSSGFKNTVEKKLISMTSKVKKSSDEPKTSKTLIEKPQQDEKTKELDDKYTEAYNAFINKKDCSTAISLCDEIIKEDPNYYKAYNLKGISTCYISLTNDNFNAGMNLIDKALSMNPNFGYAVFNKALAYELYGHYDDALEWYNKDLSIESYVWTYYGMASIYGRKGDVQTSTKYLKTAIGMDSSIKGFAKDEPDFNNVRDSSEFKELVDN